VSELAIDLQGVSKTYSGGVHALRDVVMQVRDGEIFGLLGPNGAGKSTLVKILLTIVRPTRCAGTMLGKPIGHRETLARIGYLPEQARFPEYLTGRQALDFVGGLHRVPSATRQKRSDRLLEMVGLGSWGSHPLRTYSKGMKQRLGLAQALINKPGLVILDEPTDGLDPVGRREVAVVLRDLRSQGATVFLNSHLLGEAERLCDRVAILSHGAVVRQGTINELTHEGRSYEVHVEGTLPDHAGVREVVASLGGNIAFDASKAATVISLPTARPQLMQPVIDELRRFGITIEAIVPVRQSLEDFFIGVVAAAPGIPPPSGAPTVIEKAPPLPPSDPATAKP
jgi:ABC-2 type transport system ATP-binding protein